VIPVSEEDLTLKAKRSKSFSYHLLFLTLFWAILTSGPWSDRARAQPATVSASADTFVDPNNPNTNYDDQRLEVTYSNFPGFVSTRYSLLQFDLSSLASVADESAVVVEVVENNLPAGAAVDLALYEVAGDTWAEDTVTFNTSPSAGSLLQTVNVSAGFTGQVSFDSAGVGTYVEQERVGDGTASFLLRLDAGSGDLAFGGNILFEDREGTDDGLNGNEPFIDPGPVAAATEPLYLSLANRGSYTVGSVNKVRDEDILSFDGLDFAMVFDGSDVGVGSLDLDAFFVVDGNTILMSFDKAASIGSLGLVDDSDLVQFEASSLGKNTAGSFSLYFDGSDVGLETNSEDVDAVMLLPDGDLLLSTVGNPSVPGVSGKDEDVLRFSPTSLGEVTGGSWSMYFDGSDVGLNTSAGEDLDGLAVAGNGDLYLTSRGSFSVSGISGEDEDVFVCTPTSLGDNTACTFSSTLLFDGSAWGLTDNDLDAISSNG
jgi:hypothetical protein